MHRDDLAAMSVDERLDEVASLLAVGFLRLKRRTGCLPPDERAAAAHFNDRPLLVAYWPPCGQTAPSQSRLGPRHPRAR